MSYRSPPAVHSTTPVVTQPFAFTNENRIALLEQKLNNAYTFHNKLLALRALQTSDRAQELYGQRHEIPNNRRLAILGDNLLDNHLCRQWMDTGSPACQFSKRQAQVVSNKNLANIGRQIGLEECIIRPYNAAQSIGKVGMATTIEAILAAVFLDAEAADKGSELDAVSRVACELGLSYET